MSLTDLFRTRTLCVALAPGQLTALVRPVGCALVRTRYAARANRVRTSANPALGGGSLAAGSATRIAFDGDGWEPTLAALAGYLKQADPAVKGLPLSVSLSTRWCRFAMVPWSDALLSEATAASFLEMQFVAVFGTAARTWAIACDDAPYGQPRLACATEREFADGLRGVALEHGHRLAGVESALSIAWRAIARSKPAAFALAEPGRLVLAAAARGRINAVQSQPCSGAWHAELAQAWQRWTLRLPELAEIGEVALVSLDDAMAPVELPAGFRGATLPAAPAPGFAAVCMMEA